MAKCIDIPVPPAPPPLPVGISITPTFPSASYDPNWCCKILPFPLVVPPLPLPPFVLNAGVITVLTNAMQAVQNFVDSLPLDCPFE